MSDLDLSAEINELRAQLEAIKAERETTKAASVPQEEEMSTSESTEASHASLTGTGDDEDSDLLGQLRELLEIIDKDIKDAKPTTLLIVFALGVLVGRL